MNSKIMLALGALVVGVAAIVGVVLLISDGEDEPKQEVLGVERTPTALVESPTSVPPTQVPPTPVPPTPVPPTEAPAVVEAAPAPVIRTCQEIRATGTYTSDEERAFFLANCLAPAPGPAAGPAPAQPAVPSEPAADTTTEDEERYRRRASQVNLQYTARLMQYWSTPSWGALSDLYELGSIALNHANALSALEPVPPRFREPHDRLVSSLVAFRNHILTIETVPTFQAFLVWVATFERLGNQLDANLVAWQRAVGIEVVSLGGLR